jgi:quinohemoprotein ethanol dehydrogenase
MFRVRLLLATAVVGLVAVSAAAATPFGPTGQLAITPAPAFTPAEQYAFAGADWITTAGGLTDNRYSTLNQVNATNVSTLKVAWHTKLGFTPGKTEAQQGNAVVYKGVMYINSGAGRVYAMDAVTGAILWQRAAPPLDVTPLFAENRGLALGDG